MKETLSDALILEMVLNREVYMFCHQLFLINFYKDGFLDSFRYSKNGAKLGHMYVGGFMLSLLAPYEITTGNTAP